MTDITQTQVDPPRRKPAHRKKAARAAVAPKPKSEFAGITAKDCCAGCTDDRCVISTVGICKHPFKSADSGCGPVTIANREKAKKIIKRQEAASA